MSPLLWLSVLVACEEFGLDQQTLWMDDTGVLVDDSAEPLPELRIDSLSPATGPTAGGTTVTLRGAGFDSGAVVLFGGSSVTATFVDEGTLTVTTPASAVETTVDVTIQAALGTFKLYDAFAYDNDAPDTGGGGGGGGGGGSVTPTGQVGGLVEFWMQVYACPACFSVSGEEQVSASVMRHAPVYNSWHSWLPTTGSCTTTYAAPSFTVTGEDLGDWAYLSTTGSSLSLSREYSTGTVGYKISGLRSTDYTKSASYDVSSSSGAWDMDGVLRTTTNFTDLQPMGILTTTIASSYSQSISASNARFSWAPSGTSDEILLVLEGFHPSSTAYLGIVLCRSADAGSLVVPSTALAAWPRNAYLNVQIYRISTSETVDPDTGHTIQGMAAFGYIGTGRLGN